jgi:hypothetical protein
MYGIAHCLVDRNGRVISCHLPTGNGALIAKAPAMADLLRDLLNGVPAERIAPATAGTAAAPASAKELMMSASVGMPPCA